MWETKTFEELYLEPSRNGIYKPKEFHGRGCKIVNMGELFAYDFVGQQDMKRVELNEKELERDTLKDGDILFGRRSLVESGAGKSSIVKNLNEPTTYESSVIRLRLNKKHSNPYFYYYWLLSPSGKGAIASIVTGANVKGIKSSDLKNIVVPTPPLPTQNKIVGILSAYDDLIENNLKRIKLLEEMAQITYEEWFVRLRFPGHESTPINPETGLPEGWRMGTMQDLFDFKNGYAFKSGTYVQDGQHKIVTIKNVQDGSFIPDTTDTIAELPSNIKAHHHLSTGDIIMSLTGNVGRVCLVYGENYLLNQRVAKVVPNIPADRLYLYTLLRSRGTLTQLENISNGAAQQNLSPVNASKMPALVPARNVLDDFNKNIGGIIDLICLKNIENNRLREARDILLPRLMTGVIDVENYNPSQLRQKAG